VLCLCIDSRSSYLAQAKSSRKESKRKLCTLHNPTRIPSAKLPELQIQQDSFQGCSIFYTHPSFAVATSRPATSIFRHSCSWQQVISVPADQPQRIKDASEARRTPLPPSISSSLASTPLLPCLLSNPRDNRPSKRLHVRPNCTEQEQQVVEDDVVR
jgi:hypothetical protein